MNSKHVPAWLRFALPLLTACAALVVVAGLPPEQQPKFEPPPAAPTELEKMHAEHLFHFMIAPGFGLDRIDRLPRRSEITLAGVTYTVIRPDLIALETKAVAYLNPGAEVVSLTTLTNRESRAQLRTRPIRGDEFRAILQLRAGKDIVEQPAKIQSRQGPGQAPVETSVIRVVGAMRATTDCAKCHRVAEGTLLGAFSYTLTPANATAPSPLVHRRN